MMSRRSRWLAGGAALGSVAAAVVAVALGGRASAGDEEAKSLPEVMRRMKYYNKSLGVDCDYCHVPNKFEVETPRLRTARWMQEKYVDQLVTKRGSQPIDCHTCHDSRARFLPSSQ